MKKTVLRALFFCALVLCGNQVSACICDESAPTALAELKNSDAVFVGKVISIEESPKLFSQDGDKLSYTLQFQIKFKVKRSLKAAEGKEIILMVGNSDCDIHFSKGEEWLIYAHLFNNTLTTSGCTRTKLAKSAAEDLKCIKHSKCSERGRGNEISLG